MSEDEQDAGKILRALWERIEARDWGAARILLADDLQVDWPGTRERIIGAENYIGVNESYPEGWHLTVLEVVQAGTRVVSGVRIDHGKAVYFATSFFTVEGGLIQEGVEYFAEEIEPPYDRSRWAERY